MDIEKALLILERKLYVLGIKQETIDIIQNASIEIEFPDHTNKFNDTALKEYIDRVDELLENFDSDYQYDYKLIKELRELLENELPF